MKFHFQVVMKDGRPAMHFGEHGNDLPFRTWLKHSIGKFGTIEPREKISKESRGYFEGALCPSYVEWTGKDPNDGDEIEKIREVFKYEFNSVMTTDLHGNPIRIAKSTSKLSRQDFKGEFIAKIVEYFVENGIPVPNPDLYKMWKNKWSQGYPLLTFWQFLNRLNLKCNMGVEEVSGSIPKDTRSLPNYPKNNSSPTF